MGGRKQNVTSCRCVTIWAQTKLEIPVKLSIFGYLLFIIVQTALFTSCNQYKPDKLDNIFLNH